MRVDLIDGCYLAGFQFFGTGISFVSLKLVSALEGLLLIPAVFLLGRELVDRRTGWVAGGERASGVLSGGGLCVVVLVEVEFLDPDVAVEERAQVAVTEHRLQVEVDVAGMSTSKRRNPQ